MEIGANSSLSVVKVNASDAGNYTCSIGSGETLQQYTVLLHILNGMEYFVLLILFLVTTAQSKDKLSENLIYLVKLSICLVVWWSRENIKRVVLLFYFRSKYYLILCFVVGNESSQQLIQSFFLLSLCLFKYFSFLTSGTLRIIN